MDFEEQFNLEHILFQERVCRTCKQKKNLMEDFYRLKNKTTVSSSYSYECKRCTISRVSNARKSSNNSWEYPDW